MMDKRTRIGVLMGGVSSEREVSLHSGKAVYDALKSRGFETIAIDVRKEGEKEVKDLLISYDIDLAFLALHGGFGEDGRMQSVLEELNILFTGSGPLASSLAMDKIASRKIFQAAGLSVPKSRVLDRQHRKIKDLSGFPLVVKPANGGSSVGLSIVDDEKELKEAVALAFKYAPKVIIEEYIAGREMTVGILEDRALLPIEIRPKRRFFDYKAKYEPGRTDYIVPAELPRQVIRLLQKAGGKAHRSLGCKFFSRVDIILAEDAKPFILEVNTIPGFTSTSLLPKAAALEGTTFPELVEKISAAALMNNNGQRRQNHTFTQ